MKKLFCVFMAILIAISCFMYAASALEIDVETTPMKLNEVMTITDFAVAGEKIYTFTLEEDSIVDMKIDADFEDDGYKSVQVYSIDEKVIEDIYGSIFGGSVTDENYFIYGEEKDVKADEYRFHQRYSMPKGTYWFRLMINGKYDLENERELPVVGSADVCISTVDESVEYNQVTFRVKDSMWREPIQPVTLEYIKGYLSPIQFESLLLVDAVRAGYYLDGFYVYRKRDDAWLYAKKEMVYDDFFESEFEEYSDYSWYPLGEAPAGYERYAVSIESYGSEVYAMDTMEDDDQLIHREVWTPNSYYIRYHANKGGKGTMKNSYFTYDQTKKLRANTFTSKDKNKKFKGWKAKYYDWLDDVSYWYYTDGEECGWYEAGKQPKGWKKYIFSNQEKVKNLTDYEEAVIHMYAVWR